jgi:aspartyl/asparaginyl beta-hydroxylase (cupin superfamily)
MNATITQDQANALMQSGFVALQNKKPIDAQKAFDQLIAQNVVNVSIWLGKAYACRNLGDAPAMLDAVEQSLALEARNPRAFIMKATHFDELGDMTAALAFYRKALSVAPAPAQTPADLKLELERAQQRSAALVEGFSNHLDSKMRSLIEEKGESAARVMQSIDLITGKRQLYMPQPKNYYFPGLPIVQFADTSAFSWAQEIEAATDDIRSELLTILGSKGIFNPYVTLDETRPQSDPHGMLNNDDWSAFYLWRDGEMVAENAALCPKTMEALGCLPSAQIDGRSPNILFSRLAPHSKIPPHYGQINTRFICHLPLIVPDGCGFRVGNETREWQEGKVWLFDDTIEHEAWNNSDKPRYILLFEVWRPELSQVERELVSNLYQVIDNY